MAPVCRSREGAWIEIEKLARGERVSLGRSREGAWIEINESKTNDNQTLSLPRGSVD